MAVDPLYALVSEFRAEMRDSIVELSAEVRQIRDTKIKHDVEITSLKKEVDTLRRPGRGMATAGTAGIAAAAVAFAEAIRAAVGK